MTNRIIQVEGLVKSYGSVQAVRAIDFYVEPGALFAFLGPNGAGKSTTIDILCTQLAADAGSVYIDGHALGREDNAIRSCIGVVFQGGMLDALLTVRENVLTRGSLYGMNAAQLRENTQRACRAADVEEFLDRPYGKLSGGQRRRADIARALVNTPKILFLDEPTTGLDPQTRRTVWQTIRTLQKENGMTVFLTTHYMEEAAQADYVAVMNQGVIAARGTPQQLREQYSSDRLRIRPMDEAACRSILAGYDIQPSGGALEVPLGSTMAALPMLEKLREHIHSFEVLSGSMDDAFLSIIGKEGGEVL